ncbi:MAG: ABC transporter permease [Pseudomonadales bacterium]|nr:ABC transporter permease [Ardenticatenaceae bacterium]MCP5190933.1 ABC transporter permease [Pseudomonadales bacterium]
MANVTELPLDDAAVADIKDYRSNSLWRLTVRRLFRQRSAVVGLVILAILLFAAIFAPVIAPYEPDQVLIGIENVKKRQAPCIHLLGCPTDQPQHLMGIDGNVRDLFSRVVYGTRVSLRVGVVTVGFAIIVGTMIGAAAGFLGGTFDNVIMRLMDVVLAFPFLLLAIAIVSVLGPGLTNAMMAIAIVSIPQYARVVRASVLSLREMDYVEASRALGASQRSILFTRVLPNALPPLIVVGTLGIATAILDTAALSFIGLGAQPPTSEWGFMLASERNQVFSAPYLVFFPGLAIMITVLAFNLLGDGLRDALDPRLAGNFRR